MAVRVNMPEPWYVAEAHDILVSIIDDDDLPVDITGQHFAFYVKKSPHDALAVIEKTMDSGVAITAAVSGEITVTVTAADTADLTAGVYHFSVWRVDVGAEAALTVGTVDLRNTSREFP